jgi:outer membrane receptor protein involved in Fe transport
MYSKPIAARLARPATSLAVLSLALAAQPLRAQATEPADASSVVAQAEAQSAAAAPTTDITVTASRIMRDGFQAPTPTTVVTSAAIARTAPANVADALNQLPALSGASSPSTANGSTAGGIAGANFLNLRNLGVNRTLVLLDGRRVAASAPNSAVDINLLPTALLQRVDVVTGGASAAWGSDAVAGVVNFVLDEKFSGVKGSLRGGLSDHGDAGELAADLSFGTSFADGRGHIIVSGEYSRSEGVRRADSRDWYRGNRLVTNPAYAPGSGQSQLIVSPGVDLGTISPGGLIASGPLRGTNFGPNGTTSLFDFGLQSGLVKLGGTPNDFGGQIELQSPVYKETVFSRATFDLTDDITAFGEFGYGHTQSPYISIPRFRFSDITISRQNPFLPASVAQRMDTAGLTNFVMGRINTDFGVAMPENERELLRFVGGFRGKIGSGWTWNAYYQRGDSRIENRIDNNLIIARYNAGIDVVTNPANGQPICRSTLASPANGCIPINLFGYGSPSSQAVEWANGTALQIIKIKEDVAAASIQGEPLSLWAGPVSVAAGVEYRRERLRASADDISITNGFSVGNFKPSRGSYNVKEAFGEIVVPLVSDQSWTKSLELNGAVRLTDYSTSGTVTTWKAGATWALNDAITLRGTRSRDIRAPNLNDLFQGGSSNTSQLTDPVLNSIYTVRVLTTGNLALDPEVANTWSGGVVLQPGFLPGFSASVDYYDISISDAITTPTGQLVVNRCAAGDPLYCGFITREGGRMTQVITTGVNSRNEGARGFDIEASYRTRMPWDATFALRGLATHAMKRTVTDQASTYDYVGEYGGIANFATPAWRALVSADYEEGPVALSLQERFISSGRVLNSYTDAQLADNRVDSVFYTDLSATYTFERAPGKAQLFMVVQNLFDQDPPVAATTQGNAYAHVGTNTTLYDVVGRYYRAGLRFQF